MISVNQGLGFTAIVFSLLLYLPIWLSRDGRASGRVAGIATLLALVWLVICSEVAGSDWLLDPQADPPGLVVLAAPAWLAALVLSLLPATGRLIDHASGFWLVLFQSFRVGVEVLLIWLAVCGHLPDAMSFGGLNYDLIAGVSAPIVAVTAFRYRVVGWRMVIAWNIIGLALLIGAAAVLVLSLRSPWQQVASLRPPIALVQVPYIWLLVFTMPLSLAGHLMSIRQMVRRRRTDDD